MSIESIKPYHVTYLYNLERIFDIGALLSKNLLVSRGLDFKDLGELEEEKGIIYLRIFKYRYKNNKRTFSMEKRKCDLREFVRFYLFTFQIETINKPIVPKFFYKVLSYYFQNVAIMVFKELKEIMEWSKRENKECLITFGHPNRNDPAVFEDLNSLLNYLRFPIPGIDGLREWLKIIIGGIELDLPKHYLSELDVSREYYLLQTLSSELMIKNYVPLTLLYAVILPYNEYTKKFKEKIQTKMNIRISLVKDEDEMLRILHNLNR